MKKAVQREPKDILSHIILTSLYSLANRKEEALATAEQVLSLNPKFSVNKFIDAISFKDLATTDRVARALREAGLQ